MANGIKIGNLDISAFKVGSSDCKVYLGDVLLYPRSVETRVVAKFNVTSTSSPTPISYKTMYNDGTSGFSAIEIDGVELPRVVSAYTFSTTGEHTVKYTLKDNIRIGDIAFQNCTGLTSVAIPNSVTSIGEGAFNSCSGLTSITIPNSVTSIGKSAFYGCSGITSCTIGGGVTSIGIRAFENCRSLTSVTIPSGVTSIGGSAFQNCRSLTSINIPSGVTIIDNMTFYNCSGLTSIEIPDSVTSIGLYAFAWCSNITSCTIGSGVTSIGQQAFLRCEGLTSITSNATTAPTISNDAFQIIKTGGTLYVPQGSTGYDVWMGTGDYYLGLYNWTKVEQ